MKKNILLTIIALTIITVLVSCSNKQTNVAETKTAVSETKAETPSFEELQKTTPKEEIPTSELITNALLKHYDSQFAYNDNDIKSTGYKMFLIDEKEPGKKVAYGYANYMEYNISDDKKSVELKAGSGATPIVVTFTTDGKNSEVVYEVLTDSDYKSAEFNAAFPESIREKVRKRNQEDIDEVERKQIEMVKKLFKEKTGTELKTEIKDEYQ